MVVHVLIDGVEVFVAEDQVMDIVLDCKVEGKEFEVLEYLEIDPITI